MFVCGAALLFGIEFELAVSNSRNMFQTFFIVFTVSTLDESKVVLSGFVPCSSISDD